MEAPGNDRTPPAGRSIHTHRGVEHVDYRVLTARRRVLILALAIATAVTIVLTLLNPPGGVRRTRPPVAATPPCAEDGVTRCVGGKADVILLPAAAAAPAPRQATAGATLQRPPK